MGFKQFGFSFCLQWVFCFLDWRTWCWLLIAASLSCHLVCSLIAIPVDAGIYCRTMLTFWVSLLMFVWDWQTSPEVSGCRKKNMWKGMLSCAWPAIDSVAMMSPRTSTLTIHRTISHRVVKHRLSITDHAGAGKTELELLCKQSNITSQYCSCFDQSPAGNCGCCRSEQNYTINSLNSFDHHSLKCD